MIVVADVTSPRERGKYLGSIGAVFAVASVVCKAREGAREGGREGGRGGGREGGKRGTSGVIDTNARHR